jgi:thymidine kinase
MGTARGAAEVHETINLCTLVRKHGARGVRVDYLIVDEAQFLSPTQVDQLAELADDSQIDVYAFGPATDFRSTLFPGSARLFELADELHAIQVEVLCWCGLPRRFNSRIHDDQVVRDGHTVLVADTTPSTTPATKSCAASTTAPATSAPALSTENNFGSRRGFSVALTGPGDGAGHRCGGGSIGVTLRRDAPACPQVRGSARRSRSVPARCGGVRRPASASGLRPRCGGPVPDGP